MKKYIKSFNTFNKIENIIESFNLFEKDILSAIKAEDVGFKEFDLSNNFIKIEDVYNDIEFNKNMSENYKKSQIYNTKDYETFLDSPIKYFFLFGIDKNELENPSYIVLETVDLEKNSVRIFKINDNIKNFYDKLTSKTIEIYDDNIKYIYQTFSNNEWVLKSGNSNEYWGKIIRKNDFYNKLKTKLKSIKINLI